MKEVNVAGAGHGTVRSYSIGFGLSIVLTAIPFALVLTGRLPHAVIIPTILLFAVVQIFVHLVFFLHLDTSSERRWNLTAFIYTLIVLVILVGASVWIMFHLDTNMMAM
jgi:cytochrome o ubiquinol oxidase subunit IV